MWTGVLKLKGEGLASDARARARMKTKRSADTTSMSPPIEPATSVQPWPSSAGFEKSKYAMRRGMPSRPTQCQGRVMIIMPTNQSQSWLFTSAGDSGLQPVS